MVERILDFWFGGLLQGDPLDAARGQLWFGKNEAIDRQIAEEFSDMLEQAGRGELSGWGETAQGALALVVLLDQFSRNIYRGQARAFAFDTLALGQARQVVARGLDQQVPVIPRAFFYLPFEHSEDLSDQDRSLELFGELLASAPDEHRKTCEGYLDYAERHREIIVRFGRYPHRNAILDRESTPEEIDFLQQPGSSF